MTGSDEHRLARAMAGALGGMAGAFAMSRVPVLRRVDDRATALISHAAAERALRVRLSGEELRRLIPLVRYSYGTIAGGVYGLMAPDSSSAFAGAALGVVLWVISDWVVLPALSSHPPHDEAGVTAMSLISHLLYGVATAIVARRIRTAVVNVA